MSILIKALDMPKDCLFCVAHRPDSVVSYARCEINGREFTSVPINGKQVFEEWVDGRPEWCPLIELPPHGRLIDADELRHKWKALKDGRWYKIIEVEDLDNAPTVIEAEE